MLKQSLEESSALKKSLAEDKKFLARFDEAVQVLRRCFAASNKILIAGNGGSAADAQHFAAEIIGRFERERKGYPAIALTTNSSILTAWSNDYAFTSVFARQLEALGRTGDVFIGISTSGNSANIVAAVKKAKEAGIRTICLLGRDGGELKALADIALVVPAQKTSRIQEVHEVIIHALCAEIEKDFL